MLVTYTRTLFTYFLEIDYLYIIPSPIYNIRLFVYNGRLSLFFLIRTVLSIFGVVIQKRLQNVHRYNIIIIIYYTRKRTLDIIYPTHCTHHTLALPCSMARRWRLSLGRCVYTRYIQYTRCRV